MVAPEVLMEGIVFGESPRWHDGRLWFSDWGANQVIALDADGSHEVVVTVPSFPMCIDFLPDGRLLVVDSAQRRILRREPDGSLVEHAGLAGIADKPWNEIVVDDRGNAYVNSIGFEFPGGDFAPGLVVLVTPAASSARWPMTSPSPTAWRSARMVRRWSSPSRTRTGSPPTTSAATAAWATGASGRRRPATTRTASAWTPRARSGTPTSPTSTASASARAARCSATADTDRGAFSCALSRGGGPAAVRRRPDYGGPGSPEPTGQVVAFPAPAPGAAGPENRSHQRS